MRQAATHEKLVKPEIFSIKHLTRILEFVLFYIASLVGSALDSVQAQEHDGAQFEAAFGGAD